MSIEPRPGAELRHALREAPLTVSALAAIGLFVLWATDQAGYPITHWAPGVLIVLALLAVAFVNVPPRLREVPVPVLVAVAALTGLTLLSFLSIAWADVPADAWEGADRTLLYLLVFSLFALWPQRGRSAALLVGVWMLSMIALAAVVLLHIDGSSNIGSLFSEGRLKYPGGYENASAATWTMVLWPALLLAASERVHWSARGAFAGGSVVLASLALLSESRGMLFVSPVMLALIFAFVPGRLRTYVVLVPVGIGVGLSAPAVLRVSDRLLHGGDVAAAMHTATLVTFAAAALVGAAVAIGGALERRARVSPVARARARRVIGALAIATLVAVIGGGWIAAGDPIARIRHGWDTFVSKRGYAANGSGNRLVSGFGSQRYDFYRVAVDEFVDHPLVGIGADNFQHQYLQLRHSNSSPHYPHSVELRTLVQTGIIGVLLAATGLGAALLAGVRSALSARSRELDPLAAAVATAALSAFAYWLLHGSFDWFWEFAGLGAPAFALLGLACALSHPRPGQPSPMAAGSAGRRTGTGRPIATARRVAPRAGALALALGAAAAVALPWLSQLELQSAARTWTSAPRTAYRRLDDAAQLNPLSDAPYLVSGNIALRFGDLRRAAHEFELALRRVPGDSYAALERGAIASVSGERARAQALLERAQRLDPRDDLAAEALAAVRAGRPVDLAALNEAILLKAERLA